MSRVQLPNLSVGSYLALELNYLLETARRYSLAAFAALFLLVAGLGIFVGAAYWSAHITIAKAADSSRIHIPATPLHGPNALVANDELSASLQTITAQPLSLNITDKTVPFSPDTIKSWIKVVNDKQKGVSYLHVDEAAVAASLTAATAPFVKAPTDQVTATYSDGSTAIIVAGKNGTAVHDTAALAGQISDGLLAAKGKQLTVPTDSVPFAALTPANFDKLIEVNIVTKHMWAYEKGQLVQQFAVSAGAPATPTPLGRFQIYQKLAVQDMRGYNANGTKYFQPHVHWINYFLPGGYAVHGVYWHPLSWFGAINSSHGCVGLSDSDAEWVYDWAPIGTTVITHA